jgi:hypothetical protein
MHVGKFGSGGGVVGAVRISSLLADPGLLHLTTAYRAFTRHRAGHLLHEFPQYRLGKAAEIVRDDDEGCQPPIT